MLAVLFVLPAYVVLSVAFGTVDFENLGRPVPITRRGGGRSIRSTRRSASSGKRRDLPGCADPHVRLRLRRVVDLPRPRIHRGVLHCPKAATHKGLILILLISPLWISYLMRIYAWQGLLDRGGPFNVLLGPFGFRDTDFLSGCRSP